jgi:ech hydrogenase subunit B
MIEILFFLIAPFVGGLIYGLERVVRARMQRRIGPPILQPFYDMFKLIQKEPFIVNQYHIIFGIFHFITLWIVVGMLIFGGNLLYVVFIHLFSTIFIILAGYSTKSIYSHIGSNRELLSILAYEPILILIASGFYLINGSFEISAIRESSHYLQTMPLLFLAMLLIVPIKLKKSPFDATEAHQEIVGGVEVEYSGVFFEFLYMAKWIEYIFIYMLVFLFAGDNIILGIVLCLIVFILVNLVDNATARVKINHLVKIALIIGLVLSILNIFGIVYV